MIGWVVRQLRRLEAQAGDPALVIKPPVVKFTGFDPDIRRRTEKRRDAADGIRQRAAKVETGASVSDVLRMAKR